MFRSRVLFFLLSALAIIAAACGSSQAASPTAAAKATSTLGPVEQRVTFKSDGLTLEGYLYKPAGQGPFPAIVWNHERGIDTAEGSEFAPLAAAFVPEGYVFFAPVRRGEGVSQGESIEDELAEERSRNGDEAADKLFAQLMQTEQLNDQLAGLAYLRSQPFVDAKHIGVAGCGDGGIEAVFGAASNAGYGGAVAISPGSDDWNSNQALQQQMVAAVSRINTPVLLIHPSMDVSKDPGQTLAKEFERLSKPFRLSLYSPLGTPEELTECFGGPGGVEIWKNEALTWFGQVMQ